MRTQRRTKKQGVRLTFETLETRYCPSAYSIVDLLPPAGTDSSIALGLNDLGLVVGRTAVSNYSRAVVWQIDAEATTAVGALLPTLGSGVASNAADVNNGGMIAGFSTAAGDGIGHAVVWSKVGATYAPHALDALSSADSEAGGLSDPDRNGVTWVAGSSGSSSGSHATVWRVDGAGNVLSTIDLEPALNVTRARDVSLVDPDPSPDVLGDEYVVVSGEVQLSGVQPAVAWQLDLDVNGNIESIVRSDLPTLGGLAGLGQSVNSRGHIAGQSSLSTRGPWHAFLYNGAATTDLGTLTNGSSRAEGLNDSDVVVGKCDILSKSGALQSSKAFVWQNDTMLDLRRQLATKDQTNWSTLFGAYDINSQGQIVGNGSVGKGSSARGHGFLMTPPALQAGAVGPGMVSSTPSADQVQTMLVEAAARWRSAGIEIRTADLGGTTLGLASGNTIRLDDNAAGWGWFIDPTPGDNSEFAILGDQGEQHRVDLLTVVMYELGRLVGYGHHEEGLMAEALTAGVRRTELDDHVASVDETFEQWSAHRADAWLGAWLSEHFEPGPAWAKRRGH